MSATNTAQQTVGRTDMLEFYRLPVVVGVANGR